MVIGITGEIGAGKTTLAKIFKSWGAELLSGDEIGWELLEPEEPTYKLILQRYGRDILDTEGRIDRRKLGRIVFSSDEEMKMFNSLIHPELLRRLRDRIEKAKKRSPIIFVDAALIVEWKMAEEFDKIIVVVADEKRRIERLKHSRRLCDEELKDRLKSQLPREVKIRYADWVIENNGDIRELREKASKIWRDISKWRERHL